MNKKEIKSEVLAAIKKVVNSVRNERGLSEAGAEMFAEGNKLSSLELDSLELITLVELLDRQFNFGYVEVSSIRHLTIGELCKRVVNHHVRAEVKKELLKLLREMDEDADAPDAEEVVFLDWGYDSMDIEFLAFEIEQRFEIDLSDSNLHDFTFGELIDCVTEKIQ